MCAIIVGFTLLFLVSFFNRFAGLRSGDGEYASGMALIHGILPYRDYFTTAPPLNILKSALLLHIFGRALIVSRVAGVVERLVIALVLFRWLVQLFRPWHAMIASALTIIISTGDRTDPIASYNHDAILFAMIAGLSASLALEKGSHRRLLGLAMVSGASAGLSLMTKQTVGLGVIACVGIVAPILLAKVDGMRRAVIWCAGFAAGCALPIALLTVWLWRMHVLPMFVQMLFVTGPAAKAGRPSDFLTREAMVALDNWTLIVPALIGLALGWRAMQKGLKMENTRMPGRREQLAWTLAVALAIGVAEALSLTALPALRDSSKSIVYYVLIGLTVWLAGQMTWLFRREISRRIAQGILFGAVAWSIAVMLSLSWPAFEAMTLPGLGFLLAATLDGVQDRFRWLPLLVIVSMVFLQVREKLDLPFTFDRMDEAPVRLANAGSIQPQLRGMRLPPSMVTFLDETVSFVGSNTQSGDTIFTYPEMGLLYPLTGRQTPTWATSHNIDVVNDAFAHEEAERLKRARPAVIVYYRLPEQALRDDERMWRRGRPSGQREIIAAVEELVAGYRLAGVYTVAPSDPPIEVYIRP
jgi:hypothetical protein